MCPRILCVEVSAAERAALAEILKEFEVSAVANSTEAIIAINQSGPFDLYVLDHWLPDLTGRALCGHIKKEDAAVPVIFCTGAARDDDRLRALRKGASAYFVKPVDPSTLVRKARTLLESAELRSRQSQAPTERAVGDYLHECENRLRDRPQLSRTSLRATLRRTGGARAAAAFMKHGGTRAHFNRWWTENAGRLLDGAGFREEASQPAAAGRAHAHAAPAPGNP